MLSFKHLTSVKITDVLYTYIFWWKSTKHLKSAF